MKEFIKYVLVLLVICALLYAAFVWLPGKQCDDMARSFGRPYYFSPVNGCWVETAQANWQRLDKPSNYQP